VGTVSDDELKRKYDLVVIGGGPAGVAGALKAAYMGRRALIIDCPKLAPDRRGIDPSFGGPTGLFSKALRDVGKTLDIKALLAQGLDNDVVWKQVRNMCGRLACNNSESQVDLLWKFKVGYLQGTAQLQKRNKDGDARRRASTIGNDIEVYVDKLGGGKAVITTEKILLCTGSKALQLPGIPFDGKRIFDADSIFHLGHLPSSVVIVGSGIVAIEFARIMRKVGAQVTMVVRGGVMSALERIGLDVTIAERLIIGLEAENVVVLEDTAVTEFTEVPEDITQPVKLTIEKKGEAPRVIETDIYLAATGRSPFVPDSLGLQDCGIAKTKRGHIQVDKHILQTTANGVFAAGDCIEGPALASTGVEQAQRAMANAFGTGAAHVCEDFPVGVWTIPEMAYFGMTKAKAIEKGFDADEGCVGYDSCLRGRVFAPDGMLKLVFDKNTQVILGVHIIGSDACEMVHYGMDLVERKATIFDVIGTLFTAVTFHELFKEAALDGNSKLEFGIQWQEVLKALSSPTPARNLLETGELRERFEAIDTSGDGSLDEEELMVVLKDMGADVHPSIVTNLIALADDDGNGTIEWPEFEKIFKVLASMEELGLMG